MLAYRKVKESDVDLLFKWVNDPVIRSNSFQSEPVGYDDHVIWFKQQMNNRDNIILIFEKNNKPAGMVRFDFTDDDWVIGINIDEEFRGKRLAIPMLKNSIDYFCNNEQKSNIIAFIKKDNIISQRVFEKAGFIFESDILINNIESLQYKITPC